MKEKQYNYLPLEKESIEGLKKLCPVDCYKVVKPKELKSINILPEALVNKYDSVVVMASGDGTGVVCYVINGNRVDFKDNKIDQMPFGLFLSASGPVYPSGCLIQHGDWMERTVEGPQAFWDGVSVSRIGLCQPFKELPKKESGSIYDINVRSQSDAFRNIFVELKKRIDISLSKDSKMCQTCGCSVEAYCVKCKAKKKMLEHAEVTLKNGRKAVKGKCPDCGTGMFKIIGK